VRCYGVRDSFKDGLFCGRPLLDWLRSVGLDAADVWPDSTGAAERILWNARIFPALPEAAGYRSWLWMCTPESASARTCKRSARPTAIAPPRSRCWRTRRPSTPAGSKYGEAVDPGTRRALIEPGSTERVRTIAAVTAPRIALSAPTECL